MVTRTCPTLPVFPLCVCRSGIPKAIKITCLRTSARYSLHRCCPPSPLPMLKWNTEKFKLTLPHKSFALLYPLGSANLCAA
ncbi:hypothetical protein NDU88_004946 [Pleurodeles waltl]|uniref:Secreted protein n=1 Tax=Pleurodeles waltl TaxID=8319 RepID=A0AAV7QHF6_PLEWA|nr:hypothetical protein NDU88_004946 [Pleurodeles waltl]